MKHYAISSIRGNMNLLLFKTLTEEERKPFSQFTNIVHLNEVLGFNTIHIGGGSEVRNLFNEDQISKINLYLMMKDKRFVIPESILEKALYTSDNIMTFDYNTPRDLDTCRKIVMSTPSHLIQKMRAEKTKASKRAVLDSYGDIKDVDFDKNTYLSIDFEFNPNVSDKFDLKHITEIGLSYINGKNITTEHYIVNEHREYKTETRKALQDSFNFGSSKFISSADVRNILEEALTKTKNLVFHEQSCDVKHFEENNINLDKHRIYDTQEIYKCHLAPVGEEGMGKKLKTFLNDNMIISKNMHNAGNDSHYTAMLFKAQVKDILAIERRKTYAPKL